GLELRRQALPAVGEPKTEAEDHQSEEASNRGEVQGKVTQNGDLVKPPLALYLDYAARIQNAAAELSD
ncbi:hypothetical protein LTR16_011670, partial [Cryomyces antarcticus]